MRIILRNSVSLVVIGGRDNLLPYNLMAELREYFSVKVKGAFFAQKRSNFAWDGRKYYITEGGKLPTGFIPHLFDWVNERSEIHTEVVDERVNLIPFKETFTDTINGITLRDYQTPAVKSLNNYIEFRGETFYFPSGVWDIATNGGKSLIAYFLYKNLENCRMLVTINTKDVFTQLVKGFKEMGEDVGTISASKIDLKPLTVAMAGTLYNRMKGGAAFRREMQQFNTLVVDEGHTAGAKQYAWVVKNLDHVGVRMIMSGTPMDQADETKALTVTGLGGKVLYKVSKSFLMDQGVSQTAKVFIHKIESDFPPFAKYDEVYMYGVKRSNPRAEKIRGIVVGRPTKYILITVYEIEHAQFLYEALEGIDGVEMVHGEDPERVDKLERFRTGDTRVLISTTITKMGLNLPLINCIIMAQGEKAKVDIKQWSGRGERAHEDIKSFEIHDFYDVGQYIENHSKERIKIYKGEGFEINFEYPATPTGMPKKN
jgi:superfamily II DNA or RNA helicase